MLFYITKLVAIAYSSSSKNNIGMESFFFWDKEEEWFRKEGVFELGFEGWVGV